MSHDESVLAVVDNDYNIYGGQDGVSGDIVDVEYVDDFSALRDETKKLVEVGEAAYISMSGNLYTIKKNKLYKDWGYDRLQDYVEIELSLSQRKAEYLIQIWEYYVEKLGDGHQNFLNQVKILGLTKLRECINLIKADNADELIEKIRHMSVRQISELKREVSLNSQKQQSHGPLNPDDEFDNVGTVLQKLNFKLYPDQYDAVLSALNKAGEIGNTKCRNTQLRYVAEEFNTTHESENYDQSLLAACRHMEQLFGIFILAASTSNGRIVYGEDIQDRLSKISPEVKEVVVDVDQVAG